MKSFKNGHKYLTIISHPRNDVLIGVREDRNGNSVEELITNAFTDKQKESMNTLSMNM